MPKFPKNLRMGAGASIFEHEPALYALHTKEADAGGEAPVVVVQDGAADVFTVYRGRPGADMGGADVGPVYSAGSGGPLAVPTGRVLVRLAKGMNPQDRRQEFASAGFAIEQTMSYAPSSAWLKPLEGGIAKALGKLDALKKTPGVEHVEPQLLMARVFKHA